MDQVCKLCNNDSGVNSGAPVLVFNNKPICYSCYIEMIGKIYKMAGFGDGGMIHLIFARCLDSSHNRRKRKRISHYNQIYKRLLFKYKFKCVLCGMNEDLTIDHIIPVSKGGSDEESNLQLMCKSCNSRKGDRIM